MKSLFSSSWNKSKQPRKQRKYLKNAPAHTRQKLMSAPLSKPLRREHKMRSLEVRKNDEVKVMRGKFSKKNGKILSVDRKNLRVQIDGLNRQKKDGEKVPVWFHPSSIQITGLEGSDNKRLKRNKKVKEQPDKKSSPKDDTKTEETKSNKSNK